MNIIDGLHLMVDGNIPNEPALFEESHLKAFFEEMASGLGMQIIHGPVFRAVEMDPSKLTGNKFQDEGGISGYVMISTSHMSIHCWPLRRTFMLDVFSCRMFDHEAAMQLIDQFFKPVITNVRAVVRRPGVV